MVEVVATHAQVFAQCDESTQVGDEHAEDEYRTAHDGIYMPVDNGVELGFVDAPLAQTYVEEGIGNSGRDDAQRERLAQERTADESPRGTYEFHGVDEETTREDGQTYRVVDEFEGDVGEQGRNDEQDDADFADVVVDRLDEVFLIDHIHYAGGALELAGYAGETVVVGIGGVELQLERGGERVVVDKFGRVGSHGFNLFVEGLLLGYVVDVAHIGAVGQGGLHLTDAVARYVVADQNAYVDVFAYVGRQVSGYEHEEDNRAQEYEHEGGTQAGACELSAEEAAFLVFPF